MFDAVTLDTALCLPAPELKVLVRGQLVGVISRISLTQKDKFALYPSPATFSNTAIEYCYQKQLWPIARSALIQAEKSTELGYWAECQGCTIVDSPDELAAITNLGVWKYDFLQTWLAQRQYLIVAFLKVHKLPYPVVETVLPKVGKFIGLSKAIQVLEPAPILDKNLFRQRLEHTKVLRPPLHPQLEALESTLTDSLLMDFTSSHVLLTNLRQVLGWQQLPPLKRGKSTDIAWMSQISALGERSKELDQGKSNYQAGTDFENVVRDSLKFLGFKINHAARGGAGGLDLACSEPYLLIGECKSGKKIPNDTAVQLLNLGTLRLDNKEAFHRAVKLIIGPGTPTEQLEKAAKVHGMAIINPHTLEKLVKLQHRYPGAIDLIELKKYLIDGRADEAVCEYIEQVKADLCLRALIVSQVRNYLLKANEQSANLDSLHAVYVHEVDNVSDSLQYLNRKQFRDILIELSSPLAGYLGCQQTVNGKESFYFLRHLIVEEAEISSSSC